MGSFNRVFQVLVIAAIAVSTVNCAAKQFIDSIVDASSLKAYHQDNVQLRNTLGECRAEVAKFSDANGLENEVMQKILASYAQSKHDEAQASLDLTEMDNNTSGASNRVRRAAAAGAVAFNAVLTRRFTHIEQYGSPVMYNRVVYNVGDGYDPFTGFFTAPRSGTYLFSYNYNMNRNTFMRLLLNDHVFSSAVPTSTGCCGGSHFHSVGGNMAVVEVQRGQVVRVEAYRNVDTFTASALRRMCNFSGVLLY